MALPVDFGPIGQGADSIMQHDLADRALKMREEMQPGALEQQKMGNLQTELLLNQKRRQDELEAQKYKAMSTDFDAEPLISQINQSAPETGKMLTDMADKIGLFGTQEMAGKQIRTLNGHKLQLFNELVNQDMGVQASITDAQWLDTQNTKTRIVQEMNSLQGKTDEKSQTRIAQLQKAYQQAGNMETALLGKKKELQEKMALEVAKKTADVQASVMKTKAEEEIKQPNREKLKRLELVSGLDPETINTEAIKYMVTGQMPALGMGSKEARADIMNAKSRIMKEKGYDENSVITMQRRYAAIGKSYDKQVASRDTMESFVTNIGEQSDKITSLMSELQRTDAKLLNVPIVEAKKRIKGSGQEQVLNMLLTEISTEASKIASGAQQSIAEPSVQAQERWNKIHDGTLPIKDLKQVIDMTVDLANTRLGSVNKTLSRTEADMQKMVTGLSGGSSTGKTTNGNKTWNVGGKTITQADIDYTAQLHKVSPEEVKKRMGIE